MCDLEEVAVDDKRGAGKSRCLTSHMKRIRFDGTVSCPASEIVVQVLGRFVVGQLVLDIHVDVFCELIRCWNNRMPANRQHEFDKAVDARSIGCLRDFSFQPKLNCSL